MNPRTFFKTNSAAIRRVIHQQTHYIGFVAEANLGERQQVDHELSQEKTTICVTPDRNCPKMVIKYSFGVADI